MALINYEQDQPGVGRLLRQGTRPTAGASQAQVRAVDNALAAPPSGLRNFFQPMDFPAAAAAGPEALQPGGMPAPSLRTPSVASPMTQPGSPSAQVRAVDNNVDNAAAIANPTSVLPQSFAPAGSVTSLPENTDTLGQINRDIAHQRSLQGLRNPNDPTPGVTTFNAGGNPDATQKFFDEANLRNAAAKGTWSPRKGYQGDDDAVKAAAIPVQNRQRLSELSLKNAGDQSIAAMRDATDRRGQDVQAANAAAQNQTTLRGQDITARGQDINAKTAAATARADQMNKDRQFGLDVQKFGQEVAAKNFDVRVKAQKDVTDQVAGMLPPGPDGKPDTTGAARYASGLNTLVAQRQEALRAQLQRTPDRKDVQQELEALESKGLAAMDQAAIRKFVVGQQTAELAQQTGTGRFNPIGTNAANSTAPITSLREDRGLFGSDYISDRGDVIPGRYLRQDGKMNQDLRTLIKQ